MVFHALSPEHALCRAHMRDNFLRDASVSQSGLFPSLAYTCIFNKMQRYTLYLYLETAIRVSGGTSTHHQERIQLYLQHLYFGLITVLWSNYSVLWSNYFDVGQLTISQYPEGPATGHLDKGFSWFPWAQERMLRWFPPFEVASTCFSCSPPDLNSVVPIVFYHTM
jgi:hypothetical protein